MLRELADLARTPFGRRHILRASLRRSAPVLQAMAAVHRRTLVRSVWVTAVTGSFGKTTTAMAVAAALGLKGGMELASNNLASVARAVLRLRRRRPEAVVEVGIDAPGQMAQQSRVVRPDCVVMTGVGAEHLDRLGTLAAAQREKARLLAGMRPPGLAVLNGDDPRVVEMARWTDTRVLLYGLRDGADVRATDIRLEWPHGTRFRLHAFGRTEEMRIRLLGPTMVLPVLAAVAVAAGQGRALDEVLPRLERLEAIRGRLQLLTLPDGVRILRDDSKASVETVHSAFDVMTQVPGRRLLVLSAPPEWPPSLEDAYEALGRRIAEIFEEAIFVGEGSERLVALAREAGLRAEATHKVAPGVHDAISTLRRLLRPGDTVLLKGRLYQRLERLALALEGELVGCDLEHCGAVWLNCATCAMLMPGWADRRVLPRGILLRLPERRESRQPS